MLQAGIGRNTQYTEVRIAAGLFALIPIQWFFVGGIPLIQPGRWWREPGAFITLCTLGSFVLVLIFTTGPPATGPVLFAWFAWFWWFGLLVWKILRSGWRMAARAMAHGH